MKRLIFFLIFGIFLNFSSFTFAQIMPDKREIKIIDIKPGDKLTGTVSIENASNNPVIVKAYFEDFLFPAPYEGIKEFVPLGSTPNSCGKWISILPDYFAIPPKQKQEVTYTINVPSEIKGGYYGILFFETGTDPVKGGISMGMKVRNGVSFYLEAQDKVVKAQINDLSANKDNIQGYFFNAGDTVLVSQGLYYITDKESLVLDRGNLKKYSLPPERKVPFTINISNKLPQGTHTLFINFDLGEGRALIKEVDFVKDASGNIKIAKIKE